MIVGDARGPSYEELWPGQPQAPVFDDLAELLLAPRTEPGPDPRIAYALAALSTYAYSDIWTMAAQAARLGLPENYCRRLAVDVDVLFVRSQAYLLQSVDGRVGILVYRGTTPTSAINWLADLEIDREQVAIDLDGDGDADPFHVHRGFYRNVRATGWKVVAALDRAVREQKSFAREVGTPSEPAESGDYASGLDRLEALYIAGHSLGGAMASLAGVLLHTIGRPDLAATIRGVYTYGAPMVGSPALADAADLPTLLGGKVFRYVYGDDIVPPVPPRASGEFKHFGEELHCESGATEWASREPTKQRKLLLPSVPAVGIDFVARQVLGEHLPLPFKLSIVDHLPANYLDALAAPIGVKSEFGR